MISKVGRYYWLSELLGIIGCDSNVRVKEGGRRIEMMKTSGNAISRLTFFNTIYVGLTLWLLIC